MPNELEYSWRHSNIPAELAAVRPLGDCVLVRVLHEPEMAGLIVMPTGARERGYQAPRIGEVIAVGPGDAVNWFRCWCGHKFSRSLENREDRGHRCPKCRALIHYFSNDIKPRHPMHVKPGDRILYWRCQANEVVINEETYQFLHEEQHVLAVLEN